MGETVYCHVYVVRSFFFVLLYLNQIYSIYSF